MSAQNEGYVAPLRPLDRPVVIAAMVLAFALAGNFIFYFIYQTEALVDKARHKPVTPEEIVIRTFNKASTANERIIAIDELLANMDAWAKYYFESQGKPHYWHDPDQEPAPWKLIEFNHSLADPENKFLIEYSYIATTYRDYSKKYRELTMFNDQTAPSYGDSAAPSVEFRTDRLLRTDIKRAIDEITRHTHKLIAIGEIFKKKNKEIKQ